MPRHWYKVTAQLRNGDELDLYIEEWGPQDAETVALRNLDHPQSPYRGQVVDYKVQQVDPR